MLILPLKFVPEAVGDENWTMFFLEMNISQIFLDNHGQN